jgi:hypothetical protein
MQSKDGFGGSDGPPPGDLSSPLLRRFADEHSLLSEELHQFDLVQLASLVGGLLTHPGWQGSSIRLQVLQHLVLGNASGRRQPTVRELERWLNDLGQGFAGQLEDPAEDVFVSRVILPDRDCLIFRGTDEGADFYLQRFLDLLQEMPQEEPYGCLARGIRSILALSHAVAARSGIKAHTVGEALPLKQVRKAHLRRAAKLGSRIAFSRSDLDELGIDPMDLTQFVFDLNDRSCLTSENLGYTTLERHPLLRIDDHFYLVLPLAVSIAIRRAVIECCTSQGAEETLYRAYTKAIAESCRGMPLLGGPPVQRIPFRKEGELHVADLFSYVDEGRLLHLLFVVDSFRDYSESGTTRPDPDPSMLKVAIDQSLEAARAFRQPPEVREGISVVIACLWGRPLVVSASDFEDKRWRVVGLSVTDFAALSWLPDFSPLDLWRVLDECEQIEKMGIKLINPSGLLNLCAWIKDFDTEKRRNMDMASWNPEDPGPPLHFVLPVNASLVSRVESADAWNPHHALTWDGRNVQVRRQLARTASPRSYSPPLYVSMDDIISGKLLSVFETNQRGWWTAVETPKSDDPRLHPRLWEACGIWIGRAAPVLEREIADLPPGPIAWLCRFEDSDEVNPSEDVPEEGAARALLTVEAQDNTVHVVAAENFLTTLRDPRNVVERLLVDGLVTGALQLSGGNPSPQRVEEITRKIVPDDWARVIHQFEAVEFRHFLQTVPMADPVIPGERDDAYSRLNLGWSVRKRSEGALLKGERTCCEYLNRLVDAVWVDMRLSLKRYTREPLLIKLTENHEAIMVDSDKWLQSARAYMSLYSDRPEAAAHAARRTTALAAGATATRILIEMALCESPESASQEAGALEISRLMAGAMHLHVLGGWSEAIRFRAKKAEIRITPLGDLDTQTDFDDQIGNPYAATLVTRRFLQAAQRYEDRFARQDTVESVRDLFEEEFWEAWVEEFGCSIDEIRTFVDNLEEEAIRLRTASFVTDFAGLCRLEGFKRMASDAVRRILDMFTLCTRAEWPAAPPGFSPHDWYPWRFRRRLSVISRPILQFNAIGDARYLIVPGMVRDGFRKVLDYCHDGGYDARNFPPGRMRSWVGATENKRGHRFNLDVSERLSELGWQARANVALTEILNAKLPRNYGDIDVLAWRDGRVLAIECKDLELARTIGEIARQLHEFRGEIADGRPDRLKRHLLRTEVLKAHVSEVGRFIGFLSAAKVEAWLIFSDVVPISFSEISQQYPIRLTTIERLSEVQTPAVEA